MKNFKLAKYVFAFSVSMLAFAQAGLAAFEPPPSPEPTSVEQCKKEGWRSYGDMFKNQGDCVSFVVTEGRNAPDGPPVH